MHFWYFTNSGCKIDFLARRGNKRRFVWAPAAVRIRRERANDRLGERESASQPPVLCNCVCKWCAYKCVRVCVRTARRSELQHRIRKNRKMFDKIYLNVCVLGNQYIHMCVCLCVGVWRKAENKELMGKTSNAHTYTRTRKAKKGRLTYRAIWVVFLFLGVFFVFAVLLLCLRLC